MFLASQHLEGVGYDWLSFAKMWRSLNSVSCVKYGKTDIKSGVHKPWVPICQGDEIWYMATEYLWDLSVDLGSCHPSITQNFEVAPGFLENFFINI
jgi:hypothetical protein